MNKVLYSYTDTLVDAGDGKKATSNKKKDRKTVDLATKLFDEYGTKYATRNGGYTRIVKIGQRKGDGALEVVLELV